MFAAVGMNGSLQQPPWTEDDSGSSDRTCTVCLYLGANFANFERLVLGGIDTDSPNQILMMGETFFSDGKNYRKRTIIGYLTISNLCGHFVKIFEFTEVS